MMELTTLANGLRVASRPMQSVETVAVGLYATTGSRHEEARVNGLAHLFEHMVFKGAGGRSARQLSEAIEDVGGELNASTDRETTAFHASLLAGDLALGVELIADLVRRPHFEPRHLELEKKVVLQELAEAYETPGDVVFDHLQEAAFTDQALGRPVLGSRDSIAAISVEDLHRWRETHYRPGGLILAGAGKLDHQALVDLAEAAFGELPSGEAHVAKPGRFIGGHNFDLRKSAQAQIALAMPAPAWGRPESYAAQLFADALGAGSSSRLFQELREEQGLAYSVSAGVSAFADCGMAWAYVAADRGDAGIVHGEVERVIAEASRGLEIGELDRARAQAKAGLLMNLESCWGQASYLAYRLLREGRLVEPSEIAGRIDRVSLDEVRAAGAAMVEGPRAWAAVGARLALAA